MCIQSWAFIDAFAVLYENRKKVSLPSLLEQTYWKRISKTDIRIRQALVYGSNRLNERAGKAVFKTTLTQLEDIFVRREIDEAIEKVVELGSTD